MIKTYYRAYDKTPDLLAFVADIREVLKLNYKKRTNSATSADGIKFLKLLIDLQEKGVQIKDDGYQIEFVLPTSQLIYAFPTATRAGVFNGFRIEA